MKMRTLLVAVLGGSQGDKSTTAAANTGAQNKPTSTAAAKPTSEPVTYTHYDVTELFDALKANAMKAQNTFKGQYVELEGYLGNIDSDGKYIGLDAGEKNYDYFLQEVQCYLKTDEQKNAIMEMNKGDRLIIRGQITNVSELLGYSLKIDSIELKD